MAMYVQWEGMPIVETRLQTKKLEIPVAVLPSDKHEHLLFVTLGFKPYKRCNTKDTFY
jgi:hypothetical protein